MIPVFDPHVCRVELRQEFQRQINLRGWKRKDLARITGIEAVTISNIMNNKQLLMLPQLDAITRAFGFPDGFYYDFFIAECCNYEGRIRPGKCGDFISQCYELGREDVAKRFFNQLQEDRDKARIHDILLDIAEKLFFSEHNRVRSLTIYDMIISHEEKRTERLAISYYRRFLVVRDQDLLGEGYKALHQLIEYLYLLPNRYVQKDSEGNTITTNLKFNAYHRLLTFYNVMEDWSNLNVFAEELERIAKAANDSWYTGEALNYQASALQGMGKFAQALEKIDEYAAIDKYFERIAQGARMFILIGMGQDGYIDDYMDWVESEEEVAMFLAMAVQTYLKNNKPEEAQVFLTKYREEVDKLYSRIDYLNLKRRLRLLHAECELHFSKGEYSQGLESALKAMDMADELGNMKRLKACLLSFYTHEQYASVQQKAQLKSILERNVLS